ncbi:O-methyltransferase [Paraliobacillus ryukyuensis]|uniref:O-methyltransferase n=1 Tax=Paraliobacillus ryukyuensis TaxID=200904 RepID=UPI0009A6CEE3
MDMSKEYLQSLLEESAEWARQLEEYAKENHVPIMEPLGMQFLMQLIRLKQPNKIVEIGAAIGYSALRMQEAYPEATITTIERDEERYQEARKNVTAYDKQGKIHLIFGDALECSNEIEKKGPFDLLFIDAAKGQYQRFFELYAPMLTTDGVIITDNVLFKGLVADPTKADKRKQKLANKIKAYNTWLTSHPDYNTSIVPVGDGVAITTKK